MKIILTSDGISSKQIECKLLNMLNNDVCRKSACIITTASSKKEKSKTAVKTKELFQVLGFECADFIDIEYQDVKRLKNYDVIYLNGGNPFYLLLQMKKSGAIEEIKNAVREGKIIIGTSAGSMVLSDSIEHVNDFNIIAKYENMDIEELKDYTALGLVDINIYPHYNYLLDINPELEIELKSLEKNKNTKYARLKDGEAVIIDDNNVYFVRNNKIIPCIDDCDIYDY